VEVRVALDTNRLTDLFRGDRPLADLLESSEEVWVPLVVLGEILAGFRGGDQRHGNELVLRRFFAQPNVGMLAPGRETCEHYARLFVQLKKSGSPIPDNDVWIAAVCLEHDLTLITRDRHFERIHQLLLK
jgi:predicted nucleic acid-binding protein